jgi:hypothetical protein
MSVEDFSPNALCRDAAQKAGHDDFGSDSYRAALGPLLHSIEHEMQLNERGRAELRKRIVNALANRLILVAWEKANAALAQAPIEAPIVILGLPRTGSSILHETLAAAPQMRTPLIWQVQDFALVHSVGEPASDDRIMAVEQEIARKNAAIPDYAAMHFENPFIPMECVALTIVDLVSTQFSTIAWAPTYRRFLLESDMCETYRWHRRALRFLLARKEPGTRWVLKAPMHSLYLDALLETYPDAVLLQTHRDPQKVVGSFCNLCATLRRAWSAQGDEARHAQADLAYAAQLVSRAVDFRHAHPELEQRFHDVAFKRFMAEPDATLAAIFAHCGMDYTPEARAAVLGYLDARPRDKHGTHTYDPGQYGLTPEAIAAQFAGYVAACGDLL